MKQSSGCLNEKAGVAIKEFIGLKLKMYLYFSDDNSEHSKARDVNENVVAEINHNEYQDILLKKKCLKHSINRTKSKDYGIGIYESN